MKNHIATKSFALMAALSLGLVACGSNGNDPTTVLKTGTVYDFIAPWTTAAGTFSAPFSTSNDGITFTILLAAPIRTMSPGLVTKVDVENGMVAVTFFHTNEVSTKISMLQTAAVRVGDFVQGGANFATSTNNVRVSVIFNGGAVCPYSFLDAAFKSVLAGTRSCEI